MSVVPPPRPPFTPPRRFDNAAEWLRSFGGIPLERIIFDPWPGTATEADLLRLVEKDKRLCELIDGTLVEKPVGLYEALVAANLIVVLGAYVRAHGLGVVSGADSTLRMPSSGRILLPDVAFIAMDRLPKKVTPVPTLAPDLAVEVLSEGNTPAEIAQKLRQYFQSGTRLVWLIDLPTRSVSVHTGPGTADRVLNEGESLEGGTVILGFSMPVADLFHNVPRP